MFDVYNYYLVSNYLYKKNIPIIPQMITYLIRFIFSSYIPYTADIKKTKFGYGGLGIVIHDKAKIGKNCQIDQNVTIGGKSKKTEGELPVIGDNVLIGAGAKILGGVSIGNNVVIGANAVVINDLPDNCVAVGVPAKIIRKNIDIKVYR